MNFQQHYDVLPNGAFLYYSDTIPNSVGGGLSGKTGDMCVCLTGSTGYPAMWRCTSGGSPGTWESVPSTQTYGTAGGANNAISVNLPGISLIPGVRIAVGLGTLTLQANSNTLVFNSGSANLIRSHLNKSNNIGSAYSAGSIVPLVWDGTEWQDESQ